MAVGSVTSSPSQPIEEQPQVPGGAPPPPPPSGSTPASNSIESFKTLLSTDVTRFDFMVTAGEARTVLTRMEALSPSEFHAAMQSLADGGQLETMLSKLDWKDQCRFLELASENGALEKVPGSPGKGPLDPPGQPTLYRMRKELPRCVNDLVHQHSRAQQAQFSSDYAAYLDRYERAVSGTTSLKQLHDLGPPASASTQWEYTDLADTHASQYAMDWPTLGGASNVRGYEAVADQVAALTHQPVDGRLWFEAKLEGNLGPYAFEGSANTEKGVTGQLGMQVTAGLKSGSQSATTKAKAFADGSTELSAQGQLGQAGISVSRRTDAKGQAKTTVKGSVGKVKASASGSKRELEVSIAKAELGKAASAELSIYANGDRSRDKAELGGGVRGSVKIEDHEAKVSLGGGARILSERSVRAALSTSHNVFAPPPELERGEPWNELPKERQAQMEAAGWSSAEWDEAARQFGGVS